jgi:DNA polymerase III epsilon subunit-like protein
MGPRKYTFEQTAEQKTVTVQEQEVKRSNNNAHLAYFDAYMTAYVFCYLLHSMDGDQLKMEKNKLNLMNFTQPLVIKTK